MNATLEGAVDFKDGIVLVMGFAIAIQPTPPVQAAANAINAAPPDQREALAAPWKWTDGEKTQFMTQFQSVVETAWDRQYEFHASKKYWEDLGSKVNVFVRHARGREGRPRPHDDDLLQDRLRPGGEPGRRGQPGRGRRARQHG